MVGLRGDVAEKLLKIVQVEGDDNRGTVGRGDRGGICERLGCLDRSGLGRVNCSAMIRPRQADGARLLEVR